MLVVSELYDDKVNGINYLTIMTIKEYLSFASKIINNNEYQRKRIKSASTVYSLLKEDLKTGCLMPTIVLAIKDSPEDLMNDFKKFNEEISVSNLQASNDKILILDGLQRTFTLMELENELAKSNIEQLDKFYDYKLRVEIYGKIRDIGILYRMLTLNTGQTKMSPRHQLEILYQDYLNQNFEGIKLYREKDNESVKQLGEYDFDVVIEAFFSYLEKNELPFTRNEILESIRSIETLSKESFESNLFRNFIIAYNELINKVRDISKNWEFDTDFEGHEFTGRPFGKDIVNIFNKDQAMAGFGAAIGILQDLNILHDFDEVPNLIKKIEFENDPADTINKLILTLDAIKSKAKKIGNSQRLFFKHFFKSLFSGEDEVNYKIDRAVDKAYHKYKVDME